MSTDAIAFWLQLLSAFGVGGLATSAVVIYLLRNYLPAYLAAKAQNLATKEDIAEITDKVESVKTSYALLVEEFKAQHSLRVAALDARLRANQEAFTHWRRLSRVAHAGDDHEKWEAALAAQTWWEENCLYLEPESRKALSTAFWAVLNLRTKVRESMGPERESAYWRHLSEAGDTILASVQLPSLTDAEKRRVDPE
jgi:hypothetical protein